MSNSLSELEITETSEAFFKDKIEKKIQNPFKSIICGQSFTLKSISVSLNIYLKSFFHVTQERCKTEQKYSRGRPSFLLFFDSPIPTFSQILSRLFSDAIFSHLNITILICDLQLRLEYLQVWTFSVKIVQLRLCTIDANQ